MTPNEYNAQRIKSGDVTVRGGQDRTWLNIIGPL